MFKKIGNASIPNLKQVKQQGQYGVEDLENFGNKRKENQYDKKLTVKERSPAIEEMNQHLRQIARTARKNC